MLDRIQAYQEARAEPSSGIGLAKWRLDGFVCLEAGSGGGALVTRPRVFSGRQLQVNTDARAGSLAVEVIGSDGKPVPGFNLDDCDALCTDSIRHAVSWKSRPDLAFVAGQEVRLRFQMQGAKLYAFQLVGAGPPDSAGS